MDKSQEQEDALDLSVKKVSGAIHLSSQESESTNDSASSDKHVKENPNEKNGDSEEILVNDRLSPVCSEEEINPDISGEDHTQDSGDDGDENSGISVAAGPRKRRCKSDLRKRSSSSSSIKDIHPSFKSGPVPCGRSMVTQGYVQEMSDTDDIISEGIVRTVNGVSVILQEEDLWNSFGALQTEMIINRGGRRMFPHIIVAIKGLKPDEIYSVAMEIVDADDRRYKYVNNKWMAMGIADPGPARQVYVHPDSPNTGSMWAKNYVSFSKVRLTNNKESQESILLHSMHKYMVSITIKEEKDMRSGGRPMRFSFPETTFIAVTAYQNNAITQLKIQNNPFAKAFRDVTVSTKRNDNVTGKVEKGRNMYGAGRVPQVPPQECKLNVPDTLMFEQSLRSSQQPPFDFNVPPGFRFSCYGAPGSLYMPWLSHAGLGYTLPTMMHMWYPDRRYCSAAPPIKHWPLEDESGCKTSEEKSKDMTSTDEKPSTETSRQSPDSCCSGSGE